MAEAIPIIGLMAGTSVDGIDASLVNTNGIDTVERTPYVITTPYEAETKAAILRAYKTPHPLPREQAQALDIMIANDHAAAAQILIEKSGVTPELIGFHGQTIYHDPIEKISIQAGGAATLADHLNRPVAHQFRRNDLLNGGQGAPLAPIYHRTLLRQINQTLPAAIVNIGGISNVTICDAHYFLGFDTGPGNALIDDAMRRYNGDEFDKDGAIAAKGTANTDIIEKILSHPHFRKTGPKSFDRMTLYDLIPKQELEQMNIEDKLATLTLLTARSILRGIEQNQPTIKAHPLKKIIICGGGSFNATLMQMIATEAEYIATSRIEDHGIDGRFIEAEMIAFIAARTRLRLPITFPDTTGVKSPQNGGIITYPNPPRHLNRRL
jgi:anhydro-N-acetylmuramic acid kinase